MPAYRCFVKVRIRLFFFELDTYAWLDTVPDIVSAVSPVCLVHFSVARYIIGYMFIQDGEKALKKLWANLAQSSCNPSAGDFLLDHSQGLCGKKRVCLFLCSL